MVAEEISSRHYEGRWVFELARPSLLADGVFSANATVLRDGLQMCHLTVIKRRVDANSALEAMHARCVQWVRDWELRAAHRIGDAGGAPRA